MLHPNLAPLADIAAKEPMRYDCDRVHVRGDDKTYIAYAIRPRQALHTARRDHKACPRRVRRADDPPRLSRCDADRSDRRAEFDRSYLRSRKASQSNYVHLDDCEVVALTDAAVLIRYEGETHWIPRSQMVDHEDLEKGDIRTVSITEWIAEQKGIDA